MSFFQKISLSVVIPAYNEEKIIGKTIDEVTEYLKAHFESFELLVVDDGSKDSTLSIIKNHPHAKAISNGENKGKGYSVRNGISNAKNEYVLFLDADHAIPISYLEDFLKEVPNYDIVIGSKYLEKTENYPLFRKVVGGLFSLLKQIITGLPYKDTQCGFKLFKTEKAKHIFSYSLIDGWCFDVEALFLAKKLNYKVLEKPIVLKKLDRVSRINIFGSGSKMLKDLIRIRLNAIQGKYKVNSTLQ